MASSSIYYPAKKVRQQNGKKKKILFTDTAKFIKYLGINEPNTECTRIL